MRRMAALPSVFFVESSLSCAALLNLETIKVMGVDGGSIGASVTSSSGGGTT